jgi:hypothetical protein
VGRGRAAQPAGLERHRGVVGAVFFSSWSQVVVLSLKTGEKQFTIGTG